MCIAVFKLLNSTYVIMFSAVSKRSYQAVVQMQSRNSRSIAQAAFATNASGDHASSVRMLHSQYNCFVPLIRSNIMLNRMESICSFWRVLCLALVSRFLIASLRKSKIPNVSCMQDSRGHPIIILTILFVELFPFS